MRTLEQSKVDGIEGWLEDRLGVEVNVYGDDIRTTTCFQANVPNLRPSPVLRVTLRALEDVELETILEDLDREQVPERLLARPDIHLPYTTERKIPYFETLSIRCDDRHYRVVRGEDRHVEILDDRDQPLTNRPPGMHALPTSVFLRSDQEWFNDIRRWRGPNQ